MASSNSSDVAENVSYPRKQERTACDLCKRMKIKCERQKNSCVQCSERGVTCHTTLTERKKRASKKTEPFSEIEGRIKRLESALGASGRVPQFGDDTSSDKDHSPSRDVGDLTDKLSTLMVDEEGTSRFLGSASGFSLFSPRGIRWIAETTGSNEIPQIFFEWSATCKTHNLESHAPTFHSMQASERSPLPPKPEADRLVELYFETFNYTIPLFDREVFNKYYEVQYTDTPPEAVSWYASLNVVLALGSISSQVRSKLAAEALGQDTKLFSEEGNHWTYFRNVCGCFVDLMFTDSSLMAVQAMCGLSFLQQLSLEPQPFYLVLAATSRLAFGIGLHRGLDECGLSTADVAQRRNVFWIIYAMDKTLSLRLGHPSVINDNDIGVDLPQERELMQYCPHGTRRYDIFRYHIQLARLESRIYNELYSASALKKSGYERLQLVGQLDNELQEWRLALPIEIRPMESILCSVEQFPSVRMLHFGYFNAVITVHRVCIHHRGSWARDPIDKIEPSLHHKQLNPRVYASQSLCLSAARSTINLLRHHTQVDSFIWYEMYYPLCAFLVVFASILHNPESVSPPVSAELELLDLVIESLKPFINQTSPFKTRLDLKIFHDLKDSAERFVEQKSSGRVNQKRPYETDMLKSDDLNPQSSLPVTLAGLLPPNSDASAMQLDESNLFLPQYQRGLENQPIGIPKQPIDPMDFSALQYDAFSLSDQIEWDLAFLWNVDLAPNAAL